jgi:hypothetical protein
MGSGTCGEQPANPPPRWETRRRVVEMFVLVGGVHNAVGSVCAPSDSWSTATPRLASTLDYYFLLNDAITSVITEILGRNHKKMTCRCHVYLCEKL